MKRIKTRALALLLSCCLLAISTVGNCQNVQAADLSAGALQYGADLSFLEGLFMSAGAGALGLDMLLKTKNDINNWDWGDVLDSPASQGQIDKANETIEKLYNNAVKDWHEKHGGNSDPTPTPLPDVSPPVTVAPINPDDVALPEDWGTLKKNAQGKGILAMGAATAYCVKEAVKGWWNDLSRYSISNTELTVDDTAQDLINKNADSFPYYVYTEYHWKDGSYGTAVTKQLTFLGEGSCVGYISSYGELYVYHVGHCENYRNDYNKGVESPLSLYMTMDPKTYKRQYYAIDGTTGYRTNLPIFQNENDALAYVDAYLNTKIRKFPKTALWPSTDLKDDYDNNRSPNLPELVTPTLRLPTLDEIKNLWQQGSDNEDNRPIYVTNFITDHVVQTTPEPEPPNKPDAKPTPTIAVVPDPGGGSGSGGSGSGTNPDNPKPENPEDEVKPYTADLKDVFPFCIPFDLIHLFEVLDAEPEAPVFKIPIELKVDNPFTGKSIVNYEDTIKIDLSDYEQPIKVIRIFEVIFFLIGLMLITRSHMIKG